MLGSPIATEDHWLTIYINLSPKIKYRKLTVLNVYVCQYTAVMYVARYRYIKFAIFF